MNGRTLLLAALTLASCVGHTRRTTMELDPELVDRLAIGDQVARFSDAVNRQDWPALGGFFADEGVWEASAGELGFRYQGLDAIRDGLARNAQAVEVVHQQVSPAVVDVAGLDRAFARTSMSELLRVRATGEVKHLFGIYSDELVKRAGRWRFVRRTFTLRRELDGGGRTLPAPRPAR